MSRFFLVRPGMRGENVYSIEHGDFSDRYTKADKATMIDRIALGDGWPHTLVDAISAYKRRIRPKARA